MPSQELTVQVGGAIDLAITDHDDFDLAVATLHADGASGMPQMLKVMSTDLGPVAIGLDRTRAGHYPIGLLRIGPAAATVTLVDAHDNDGRGETAPEAVYADTLVIEPTATLNTAGMKVYYNNLTLCGTVDDAANPVEIGYAPPDFDCECDGNLSDYLVMQPSFSGSGVPTADSRTDRDGDSDLADLVVFQSFFTGAN